MPKSKSVGKGSAPRPRFVSKERYDLNWDLAMGRITRKEYVKKVKEINNDTKLS